MVDALKSKLNDVYGPFAQQVYHIYEKVDPIKYGITGQYRYWNNVTKFLEQLHNILYKKDDNPYSLGTITVDNYFFITQICVLDSFTVFERITLLNQKDAKNSKLISNKITHEVLHNYLTYLKQIPEHSHYLHEKPTETVVVTNPLHVNYSTVRPVTQSPPQPPPHQMMMWPYNYFMQHSHPVPTPQFAPLPHSMSVMPPPMTVVAPSLAVRPIVPSLSFIPPRKVREFPTTDDLPTIDTEIEPSVVKDQVPTMKIPDHLPLNFYTVIENPDRTTGFHVAKLLGFATVPPSHKVPNIHPIPVHPQPPV